MANGTAYPRHGDRTPTAQAQRAEHWRRVLARQEQSGLTRAAFCRREGMNEYALTWWTRELKERGQSRHVKPRKIAPKKSAPSRTFVPVRLIQVAPRNGAPAVEVVTKGGYVVRVQAGFDPAMLRQVLAALEVQPC